MQWDALVFKVGGKIFAIAPLEPDRACLSFKVSDEEFAELVEREGVIPAPYLARAKWIALEDESAMAAAELSRRLRESYDLVFATLPRKVKEALRLE